MANYFCTDSVEEQVDYLIDKIKDLKTNKLDKAAIVQEVGTGTDVVMSQKAVTDVINENLQTVNENLQTINTEINGKLTKPTNPTAESAVTMLADGTVGTKPLSEIGGGGKIYRHEVIISKMSSGYLHCIIINNIKAEFTASDLNDLFFKKVISASVDVISAHKTYTVKVITVTSTGISATYYASYPFSDTVSLSFPQDSSFTDTVIEI